MQIEASKSNYAVIMLVFCILLFLMVVVSLGMGRLHIAPMDVFKILCSYVVPVEQSWNEQAASVIYTLRLPRVLAAILIGAALSLSGAAYQSVFKNPLVAPDMLGVSSGACVGASLCILLGLGSTFVQMGAFASGMLAVGCAVIIPRIIGKNSIVMLVLSGLIVSGLMNALLGIIKYLADSETQLPEITYWQLGSLVSVTWENIFSSGIPIVICLVFMLVIRWRMNILTLSDEEVHMLGRDAGWLRYAIILCATVLTMSAEIPLSILTGLIGAPFYFYLLLRQRLALS